jgi:hypothetical protein
MKKILFLIPLLGICSSLFAQAPQVTNVQAEQIVGTKDVQVSFELTGKPGADLCFIEVWFKADSTQTQWQQVKSIPYDAGNPNGLQEILFDLWDESGNPLGQDKAFTAGATESPQNKTFTWNAGNDAPDVNTEDAQIRIIAFYPKMEESGTEKPTDQQKSGWDGIEEFGGPGGTPDGNGTSPSGDVYVRDYADTNNYYVSPEPGYANLFDRIQEQYGISPFAPTAYFDDASEMHLDVFELPDNVVMELTGMNPPSGMLVCATLGDNLIPVMLQ